MDTTIHVTGPNTSETLMTEEETFGTETVEKYGGHGTIHHRRPNMLEWFQQIKDLRSNRDVAVSLCGPKSMMAAARKVAAKVSSESGLFFVEEEEFKR
jgi:acetate kinase